MYKSRKIKPKKYCHSVVTIRNVAYGGKNEHFVVHAFRNSILFSKVALYLLNLYLLLDFVSLKFIFPIGYVIHCDLKITC